MFIGLVDQLHYWVVSISITKTMYVKILKICLLYQNDKQYRQYIW